MAGIQRLQLGQGPGADIAGGIGAAIEPPVMKQRDPSIGGGGNIHFDHLRAEPLGDAYLLKVLPLVQERIDTLEAFFELTNALAERNPCCTEYDIYGSGSDVVIDPDEDYWPRLIPSLGVVWKF